MNFNKFLQDSRPYKLVSHKAWELESNKNVLKLDWNESSIPTSSRVKKALTNFIQNKPLNWYPDVLNDELLTHLSSYTGLHIKNIQYFASSDSLHEYILRLFQNENSEITIVYPTYDNFRSTADTMGYRINYFMLKDNFTIDQSSLVSLLRKKRQDLLYICSPNNPTGTEVNTLFIEDLAKEFKNTAIIIDEAYYEFGNYNSSNLVNLYPNILITRTFSKAFGLAGLRVGYLLANEKIITLINKIRNPKNISSLSQVGAIVALQDTNHLYNIVKQINRGKYFFIKQVIRKFSDKLLIFYGGGNFVLIKIKNKKANDLIQYLENRNVFIRDLSHLKNFDDYVRITMGKVSEMKILLNHLSNYYDVNK